MKRLVSSLALVFAAAGVGAATLVGDATLHAPNDLTVVRDGAKTYEFLDLTSTYALPVATAIANHQAEGFRWANAAEMAVLLSAFEFSYTLVPGGVGPLTYHGSESWLTASWNLISRLGADPQGEISGAHYLGGFVDDMPIAGNSTYLYLNAVGVAEVVNDRHSFQAAGIGTFLVRDAAPVPEPGTVVLWLAAGAIFLLRSGLNRPTRVGAAGR